MGFLTTHVLDTQSGIPANALHIELFSVEGDTRTAIKTIETNDDGRADAPLLKDESFKAGIYELVFHAGDYFRASGVALPDPAFLDQITIRFGISDTTSHYHVPLLVTPWSYSTYRGS